MNSADRPVAQAARQLVANSEAVRHVAIRVVTDYGGLEVALGHQGIGVFVTVLSAHGKRRLVTNGYSEDEAVRLGRALIHAAEASRLHRTERPS